MEPFIGAWVPALQAFVKLTIRTSIYTEGSVAGDQTVGDAKRRKASMGDAYGNPDSERIFEWLPLTRGRARWLNEVTTRGAWIGIGALVVYWIIVRFVGPILGLWSIAPLD